jgi:hypothetical protein
MKRFLSLFLISFCFCYSVGFAQTAKVLSVAVPISLDTGAKKLFYYYELQEKLRILHNQKGEDFRNGVITKDEWEKWLKEYFDPRQEAIIKGILEERENAKKGNTKEVNFETDFIQK